MSVVCVGCGRDEVYGREGWRFGDVEGYFRGAAHGRTLVVESGDEKRGWDGQVMEKGAVASGLKERQTQADTACMTLQTFKLLLRGLC